MTDYAGLHSKFEARNVNPYLESLSGDLMSMRLNASHPSAVNMQQFAGPPEMNAYDPPGVRETRRPPAAVGANPSSLRPPRAPQAGHSGFSGAHSQIPNNANNFRPKVALVCVSACLFFSLLDNRT